MLEKSFIAKGAIPANTPIVLNTDGTVSKVDAAAQLDDNAFEWPKSGDSAVFYNTKYIKYLEEENLVWTMNTNGNTAYVSVFSVEKRKLVFLKNLTVGSMNSSSDVAAVWDEHNKQMAVVFANYSQGRKFTAHFYKWENSEIVRTAEKEFSSHQCYSPQLKYCQLHKCAVMLSRSHNGNSGPTATRVLFAIIKNVENTLTTNVYDIFGYQSSVGSFDIDQSTGVAVVGYGRGRYYGSDDNQAIYRVITINGDTATVGTPYTYINSETRVDQSPKFQFFPEKSKWVVSYNGAYRWCSVNMASMQLNYESLFSVLPPTNIAYYPEFNSYLAFGGTGVAYISISESGEFVTTKVVYFSDSIASPSAQITTIDGLSMFVGGNGLTFFDLQGRKTNVSEKTFIGFSSEQVIADGEELTPQLIFGPMNKIKTNQNGLVNGKEYFIDFDGELTQSPVLSSAPTTGVAAGKAHLLV